MSSSLPDDRVAASSQPPSSSISSSSSPNSMVAAAQPSISPNPRTAFGLVRGVDPDSRASYSQLLAMADHDAAPQRRAAIVPHQITATPADALFDAIAPPFTSSAHSLLPSVSGAFTISQQQNTEHVVDQVRWLDSQIHSQPLYSSCMSSAATTSVIHSLTSSGSMVGAENMQILSLDTKASESGFNGRPNSEQGSNSAPYYVDKPCDDGYNWRKYGQKHVKGSEYPRSYYKCTYRDCLVKKMVERSLDGQITEIIYKGQHNHEQPSSTRRSKDTNIFQQESNRLFGVIDKASQFRDGKLRTSGGAHNLLHGRVEETNQANLGCCNDEGKIDGEIRTNYQYNHEPDQKRSRIADTGGIGPVSSQRTVSEPKVVVQTRSEVDLLDDGYRWRKYGQKVVKGSSHPRSYYKCTYAGCSVRKHIERASTDPRSVITTYEGKHNHDVPTPRNSNHNHAASSKSFPGRPEYESINQLSTMGSLRMKEQGIN